ncbi:hypothetical protein [Pseudoalteromonas xiamenensis]|uniref:Uncharacterized protein n=1 Tax=Pseudoalteromonas xiamenensis TaxID=882626 RepID=A0A975HLQ5_9GAMM|nr:hypothetical protein [Pseudoalteromonas xiamenensis]QTH72177.1 hypothetical protein J5O05_04640 [Pseudoalteromonas xiamenensis]
MDTESQIIAAVASYKIVSLLVGSAFAFMGYKLFMAGVWGDAGDVEAKFRDNSLIVKKAAPGTFFALFGAIVICVTLFKGLELRDKSSNVSHVKVVEIVKEDSDGLPEKPPF